MNVSSACAKYKIEFTSIKVSNFYFKFILEWEVIKKKSEEILFSSYFFPIWQFQQPYK